MSVIMFVRGRMGMRALLYVVGAVIAAVLVYIMFLAICSLFVAEGAEYDDNSRFYRHLLYGATGATLWLLRIRVKVTGTEKIPEGQKPLFVGNHLSNFDPIIEWQVLRRWELAFISKEANFHVPVFGRFIRKCCFMAIDRSDPGKALGTINRAVRLLKKGEVSVGVYPEGTRNRTGGLLPFHTGVFRIAQKADAPIVVMRIRGTEDIHRNVFRRRSEVMLDITDVIPADEVKRMKKNEIEERVRCALA